MKERILISSVKNHIGESVKIAGFAQVIRAQKSIVFFVVRDVSGAMQAVVTRENAQAFEIASGTALESVVEITGLAKEEKQAPGGIEIAIETIAVLSKAEPLPIPVIEKGSQEEADQSLRLDWRWIDLRKEKNLLIFKVWTLFEAALREHWLRNDYIEIHSPKLIGTPSESGAEVFEAKYFERKAYLAQSPQFYKQMAMAAGFEKVFEVGPVFRAEPSFTSRHATEFVSYDTEISYIRSHDDVMQAEEKEICDAFGALKEAYGSEVRAVFGREITVPAIPFPKVSMAEAKIILGRLGVSSDREGDLSPEEERAISEYYKKEQGHEFVFVTDYPVSVRPFYHMRHEGNPQLTKSFDLLFNGLEVTTGAQREHRYDILKSQAKEKGINTDSLEFYLNFFKYGCPPHGGYGMGASRIIMKLLGLESVRDAMFLFRGVNRLTP